MIPRSLALCVLVAFCCMAFGPCSVRAAAPIERPEPPKESAPPRVVTPAKAGETETESQLRQARDAVATLAGDLARWQQRVATLTADRDQDRRDAFLGTLRASCLWVAGLALLAGLACTVAAFLSPIAKPTLVKAAVACGVLVVLATGCAWAVPWLPTVGVIALLCVAGAVLVAGVVLGLRWFPRFATAAVEMADGFQQATRIAATSAPNVVDALNRENRSRQIQAGAKVYEEGGKLLKAAAALRTKRPLRPLPAGALP